MTSEQYKSAVKLQSEIDNLEYEIKIIKDQLDSKNKLIRFGGNYNVSHPIEVDSDMLTHFLRETILMKQGKVLSLLTKFNNL